MLEKIVNFSLKNKTTISLIVILLTIVGIYSIFKVNIDAIPDISENQVIITARYEGQDPITIEEQVSYKLVSRLLSIPKIRTIRAISMNNIAFVYIIFKDGVNIYWARSRVLEYIAGLDIPKEVNIQIGPPSSSISWIVQYVLISDKHTIDELTAFNEFILKPYLQATEGVSEIATIGGFIKEYQIDVDPYKLKSYNLSFEEVLKAIENANLSTGGRFIEIAERYYNIRGYGYIRTLEDIENISIKGIKIKDIGIVQIGPSIREGALDYNAKGESVGGIIISTIGENAYKVIRNVKEKIKKINLPEGMKIEIVYDRSYLIEESIKTLISAILKESLIIAILVYIFLVSIKSSISIIIILPLSVILSIIFVKIFNITLNIMSLGGFILSLGVLIDMAVVLVESSHKYIEQGYSKIEAIEKSVKELSRSIFFSLLIITISFLPVFFLTGEEGKLFKPLAITKTFSMLIASILSISFIIILIYFFLPNKTKPEMENPINRIILKTYEFTFKIVYKYPLAFIVFFILFSVFGIFIYKTIKSEFLPPFNEGSILYMPSTTSGISIQKGIEVLRYMDSIIISNENVRAVFGKISRANTATDPAPPSMIETNIELKDPKKIYEVINELSHKLNIPGFINTFSMPIRTRIDMLKTGIRTPLGIKVYGNDPYITESLAIEIEKLLRSLRETKYAYAERLSNSYYIIISPRRERISQYNISIKEIMDIINFYIGGNTITYKIENRFSYPIRARILRDYREIEYIKRIPISTTSGFVSLEDICDIQIKRGFEMIRNENGFITSYIYLDSHDDYLKYIQKVNSIINSFIKFPSGYFYEVSGQYEDLKRVQSTLVFIIPMTIFIIFILLYMNFKSLVKSILVLILLIFPLSGAFITIKLLNYNLSIAVWIGIVALLGISTEIIVVKIAFLDLGFEKFNNKYEAIHWAVITRLRPITITTLTAFFSLIPIMFEFTLGADIIKRIVAPMIGGIFFTFILSLYILPSFYVMFKK
ncbi:MAG: CusA/CzcA family heavy metal efflux RND transporter [candidate division WOR-3 bacterium]|nr:CusA/CzcA family heavy metal efflux RND transporter [candidate division WOR-3 bacterium]